MSTVNYRVERVDRLLAELRYEITRGMIEGELDESLGFRFVVPCSKSIPEGVVWCEFITRPRLRHWVGMVEEPKLRVVK